MTVRKLLNCQIVILLLVLLTSLFTFVFLVSPVLAECPAADYQCQINELQVEYDSRKDAHEKNKTTLSQYEKELASLNSKITVLEANLKLLEKKILNTEVDLGVQEEILAAKVHSYYINSKKFSPFLLLLSSKNANELVRELSFRQQAASRDRKIITSITENLSGLNTDKQTLEKTKISLASLKAQSAKQTEFMRQEVAKTETFFAQITAKQKELEALKAGGFSTSVGDVPLADDPASRPDYNPGFSPAFAAFSFGAPHRQGMSQYGAYGRAKAGQSAEQILKAYYGNGIEVKKDYSTGINITVSGYGTVDIETYTKRIYEMPASWGDSGGMEALKAQAVAARSYALAHTNNGASSICATEACQVYKPANKGGKWDEAVDATRGWVVMANGKPFSTMYASTSGGYTISYTSNGYSTPGLWDTTGGRGAWTDGAYEKLAASPWFYKSWYRTRSSATCGGRNHPWLTSSDMADILNAWQVLFNGVGGDAGRIYPPDNCGGGNPYSKSELQSLGGFTDVSGVAQVIYGDDGSTLSVVLSTNKGNTPIKGEEFKKAFNLRAPGYIGIKSSLFNLVKK